MTGEDSPRIVLHGRPGEVHGVNDRLRRAGALVPVEIEGVRAWAAVRYGSLQAVLDHPDLSRDIRHWSIQERGCLTVPGAIAPIMTDTSMLNAEGGKHRQLRGSLSRVFSARRIAALQSRIEAVTAAALDALDALPSGPVDLRRCFTYPLPCEIIAELLDIPPGRRPQLYDHSYVVSTPGEDRDDVAAARAGRRTVIEEIVADRRRVPGTDLISELVSLEGERLTFEELLDTVELLFVAGHVTTVNFFTNAIRTLLSSPAQLDLLRSGAVPWSAAVEELLRLDTPLAHFPMRYAVRDVVIEGVRIRKGEAVLACFASAGRDPGHYGERAGRLDVSAEAKAHLSFGQGPHFCLGAPLARLEAEVALSALFRAFPRMVLAEPVERLPGVNNVVAVSTGTLPVLLGPRSGG